MLLKLAKQKSGKFWPDEGRSEKCIVSFSRISEIQFIMFSGLFSGFSGNKSGYKFKRGRKIGKARAGENDEIAEIAGC